MTRKQFSRSFLILILVLAFATSVLAASGPHWTYDGEEGPAYWGVLSPDYALCGDGQSQSPIDIPSSAPGNPADLVTTYNPSAVNIFNNGHTIQVNYDPGSTLMLDSSAYELVQFHFHALSEHTVDGGHRPMEIHFVHKNAQGKLAVVGVLLAEGAANADYAAILDHLPTTEGDPVAVPGAQVDADNLMPATRTYWRYSGSLTTPPCTEGVSWLVMNNPVELASGQIAAYTAIFDHNSRPIQPINNRQFIVGQAPATLPTTGADLDQTSPTLWYVLLLVVLGGLVVTVAVLQRRTT